MNDNSLFQLEYEKLWEDLGEGIQRQVMGYDDRIMLVKVKFETGAVGVLHEHHHSQVSYVESGIFETNINGVVKILKAGDAFYVPPHEIHGVICKEAGMLIDVFSPQRSDFLPPIGTADNNND